MTYYVGSIESISARILDGDGMPVDPTTLTFAVTSPLGVTTTYTAGVDAEIVHEGQGLFRFDLALSTKGNWTYLWTASGNIAAELPGEITATPLAVPIVLHVEDANATALKNVIVQVLDGRWKVVAGGYTDSNGNLTVYVLPDKTYTAAFEGEGLLPLEADITVVDAPAQAPFVSILAGIGVTGFTPQPRTLLYGYAQDAEGRGAPMMKVIIETVGYRGRALLPGGEGIAPANVVTAGQRRELVTGTDGMWSVSVLQGSTLRVSIPSARYERFFEVPADVTVLNIADARTMPGAGGELGITSDTPTFDSLKGVS